MPVTQRLTRISRRPAGKLSPPPPPPWPERCGIAHRASPLVHHAYLSRPMDRLSRLGLPAATEANRNPRMTPRPIYRWKSFWLGLCVWVFLGWARSDSFETEAAACGVIAEGGLIVARGSGSNFVLFGSGVLMPNDFTVASYSNGPPLIGWYPWAAAWEKASTFSVSFRDSHVLLFLFALWSAWLFRHWKREQRKLSS